MKQLLTLLIIITLVFACANKPEVIANTYGEAITTDGAFSLASLQEQVADKDSVILTLKGTIEKTCAKKGCWMTVQDENGVATRVTFKDYGFFVPTEGADGKEVVFSGVAKRKVTDVATLRHFAEDDGKTEAEINAITEPKQEIEFVATGVVIYDKGTKK
ncbi:MAG: DUF4920 domain-containing protein [Cyclobacteriaceae bacterium]|nr:DUF4920 domain-containing protein [Cyclobacteriaceae bacterium]